MRRTHRSSSGPRGRIPQAPRHHPIAPTEFLTGLAAAREFGRLRRRPTVLHEPRKRRIPSADHAEAAIGMGLPPSCWIERVANGQQSTASNVARQRADGSPAASSGPGGADSAVAP